MLALGRIFKFSTKYSTFSFSASFLDLRPFLCSSVFIQLYSKYSCKQPPECLWRAKYYYFHTEIPFISKCPSPIFYERPPFLPQRKSPLPLCGSVAMGIYTARIFNTITVISSCDFAFFLASSSIYSAYSLIFFLGLLERASRSQGASSLLCEMPSDSIIM